MIHPRILVIDAQLYTMPEQADLVPQSVVEQLSARARDRIGASSSAGVLTIGHVEKIESAIAVDEANADAYR